MLNILPPGWVVIGSDILTVAEAGLGTWDNLNHTSYMTNPINLALIAILGLVGIHRVITATLKKPKV